MWCIWLRGNPLERPGLMDKVSVMQGVYAYIFIFSRQLNYKRSVQWQMVTKVFGGGGGE